MKVVAWVPIKMNNERLPGKNILPLAGKPLCQHVLGELQKLSGINGVYAFCSDAELDTYLPNGVERIPRDETLNSFQTKINDVILAFSKAIDADVYVYAQVTSPFLKAEKIQEGLNAVISDGYDSSLSVKVLRDFLWKDKKKPHNYDPAAIARTQDLNPYYQETGGFYIYTKELIQKYNRRTGFNPYLVELSEIESVDIDYREDYELAQAIALKDNGRVNDIYNIRVLDKWLDFNMHGGDINCRLEKWGIKTYAIYGCGVLGKRLYQSIDHRKYEIRYFIDRCGGEYEGVPFLSVENAEKDIVDLVIITPGFDKDNILKSMEKMTSKKILLEDILSVGLFPDEEKWDSERLKKILKKNC